MRREGEAVSREVEVAVALKHLTPTSKPGRIMTEVILQGGK